MSATPFLNTIRSQINLLNIASSISLINVILTLLISSRLFAYRRQITAALPAEHAQYYVSLAAIFIESAALYSVCALLFLITYAINSPTNQIFLGMTNSGQQIATYLIIYRVADGTAWSREAMESKTLTSFNAAGAGARTATDVRFTTELSVSGVGFAESKLEA